MAGKKSKKKSNKDEKVPTWLAACIWAGLAMTVMAGLVFGAVTAWRHIREQPYFAVDASELTFGKLAPCIKKQAMGETLRYQLSAIPSPMSIFDKKLARRVAEELEASPWVLEVSRITRQLPNKLGAELTFRRPAAMVRYSGSRYLVDRNGYWLPHKLYKTPSDWDEDDMPVLTDSGLNSPPPVGDRWGGPRLAAGARLVEFLESQGALSELDIESIDVTAVGSETSAGMVLNLASGTEVWWGSARCADEVPGLDARPHEPSDKTKLNNLCEVPEEYPGFQGLARVDLRVSDKVFIMEEQTRVTADVTS